MTAGWVHCNFKFA